MSSAREKIFQAIRRNKRAVPGNPSPEQAIAAARPNTIPAQAQLDGASRQALFERKLLASGATLDQVSAAAGVPAAVLRYLSEKNLPAQCYVNGSVAELDWAATPEVTVRSGAENVDSPVCVTVAFRGIAETGSLVLLSAPGSSSASHFLPEELIVTLGRDEVLATQEAVWADLRKRQGGMPRTVNLVTGPSRTGDIEQKIVLGAHGPKHVHVILVG